MTPTDYRQNLAHTNEGGVRLVCILVEGNITVADNAFSPTGLKGTTAVLADELSKDEWVAIDPDAAGTYAATGGCPLVKKVVDTANLGMGKIVDEPRWVSIPSESHTTGLADRLENGFYRIATVWFPTLCAVAEVECRANGSNHMIPGTGTAAIRAADSNGADMLKVEYDASGTGVVILTYAASGTAGDQHSMMLGFTGGVMKVNA